MRPLLLLYWTLYVLVVALLLVLFGLDENALVTAVNTVDAVLESAFLDKP